MHPALGVVSALMLARFARERQIEIIHAHVARDYPLAALTAWRAGGIPFVLTRHVLFPMAGLHKLILRRVARVIAVSQAVSDELRAQGIFDQDKIVLIRNGIDSERFNARTYQSRNERGAGARLRVGMIGDLAPVKGQEDFIRAAAIVIAHRDDVEFIIAGGDKSRKHRRRIEGLISELNLSRRVCLTGWVENVNQLFNTLDLFVSASRSESFGLTIAEAMANGVPVIATATAGAREIIDGGKTGRLIPVGDVKALAESLCELLADPEQRQQLSTNAQREVAEKFSLEQMVTATERVYREVLGT